MITRVDNNHYHHPSATAPHMSPSAPSKSSPPNTNGHSTTSTSSNNSLSETTSKLCHISSQGLSHATTVDSSAQGVELMQGSGEMYDSPLQPWAAPEGIAVMNHSASLASSR